MSRARGRGVRGVTKEIVARTFPDRESATSRQIPRRDACILGADWAAWTSNKAVVFLENHDTQRDGGISYRNGDVYRLANVWMLAQPYGHPKIMSSYAFDRATQLGRDRGPPADASGATNNVSCAATFEVAIIGQWVCEHRDPYIAAMVAFRREVAGTAIEHWWDNGANAIAFSRGSKGFVAISREHAIITDTVQTGLPAGTYCDVLTGGRDGTVCQGTTLVVDATGTVQLDLAPNSAIAIR